MTGQIAYIVNASTGEVIERPLTVDELDDLATLAAAAEIESAAKAAAEAKKAAILAALADAAGLDPDDVAQALGV